MRKSSKWILFVFFDLALVLVVVVGPIDRTPLKDQSFYSEMIAKFDTLKLSNYAGSDSLKIGWSKKSITPDYSMPMAGYKPRDAFESVHDSLYARVVSLDHGGAVIYFISLDLLIFPSDLRKAIELQMPNRQKPSFLYLSATHTHNGVGGWDNSIGAGFAIGNFDKGWIQSTASIIIDAMNHSVTNLISGSLYYREWDATQFVANRLSKTGSVDGIIRGIEIVREDNSKALILSYSGHPTSISKEMMVLSGDYPAELMKKLDSDHYDFSLFMAGMMGSHTITNIDGDSFELCENIGDSLSDIISRGGVRHQVSPQVIKAGSFKIPHGPSQLRIGKNWKIRDWVFTWLFGSLEGSLSFVEIGDLLMIGTPCDFSGELFSDSGLAEFAAQRNKRLMITSFNGEYTGYITDDKHYDTQAKEEVRALNWVGPYFGQYYIEMIEKIILKSSE